MSPGWRLIIISGSGHPFPFLTHRANPFACWPRGRRLPATVHAPSPASGGAGPKAHLPVAALWCVRRDSKPLLQEQPLAYSSASQLGVVAATSMGRAMGCTAPTGLPATSPLYLPHWPWRR